MAFLGVMLCLITVEFKRISNELRLLVIGGNDGNDDLSNVKLLDPFNSHSNFNGYNNFPEGQ